MASLRAKRQGSKGQPLVLAKAIVNVRVRGQGWEVRENVGLTQWRKVKVFVFSHV